MEESIALFMCQATSGHRTLAAVSNSEMSNFSQDQENQGITRRRTCSTSHPAKAGQVDADIAKMGTRPSKLPQRGRGVGLRAAKRSKEKGPFLEGNYLGNHPLPLT